MDKTRKAYFLPRGDMAGASSISLAPTFFKSQSALVPLLLLSKSNPLLQGLGFDLVMGKTRMAYFCQGEI
jgi:hypothetical protein